MANLTVWETVKELKSPKYKWVDLTHELSPETPHLYGFSPLEAKLLFDYVEGTPDDMMAPMRCFQISVASQYGTHVDVPRHFWGNGRPVVVVGGGPGGLECAIILAKRGFAVTLLEKDNTLGGTLNIAKLPPFKANLQGTIDVLALEARENGVDIRLNTEATPELVKSMNPVGVFLAAGAPPVVPQSIPGIAKAVLAEDVILGKVQCQGDVVLIGTGLTGLECAEMILEQGHKLTMVEMNPTVGQGIYNVVFDDIMSRITPHSPTILTSHQLTAVTDSGAEVKDLTSGGTKAIAAGTVVLALGTRNQAPLAAEFEAAGLPTVLVGSAETPGRIAGAIRGGFEKAWVFEAE